MNVLITVARPHLGIFLLFTLMFSSRRYFVKTSLSCSSLACRASAVALPLVSSLEGVFSAAERRPAAADWGVGPAHGRGGDGRTGTGGT